MAFIDIKNEAILGIKNTQPCDTYPYLIAATDFQSLIKSGCGDFAWIYQVEIISDASIETIPDSDLNAYAIYKTDVTLTNPTGYKGCHDYVIDAEDGPEYIQEIFFLNNSNSTINLNDGLQWTVYVMGNANVTIHISNNTSVTVRIFNNAICNIDISGGQLDLNTTGNSLTSAAATGSANVFGITRGNSIVSYSGSNNTTAIFKLFINSMFTYSIIDSATIEVIKSHNSTAINASP